MSKKGFTVLVADQHSVTRAGVKAILCRERGCKVVEASDGREAVKMAMKHKPQVAIMGINMPRLNGLEAANQILTSRCGTRVLMLTAARDDFSIERAMWIGVHGYLCKTSPVDLLPEAVRALRAGQQWFEPLVQNHLARHAHIPGYRRRDPLQLTSREIEILQLVAEGYSNKDIGTELEISEKTVDKHRQNLMDKLNIRDTAGLTRYAMQAGIIEPK